MTGILEQMNERITRLEQMANAAPVAAPVAAVSPQQIMELVTPLLEIPAAQSELKAAVSGMGYNDLASVPTEKHGEVYVAFKQIHDRYVGAGQIQQAAPAGGLSFGGAAAPAPVATAQII